MLPEVEKVEYYLENGEKVEYAYSPGSSIYALISDVVDQYYMARPCTPAYWQVWVRGDLLPGYQEIRIATNFGAVRIDPVDKLRYPIFAGTPGEYRNNEFDYLLEKVLTK